MVLSHQNYGARSDRLGGGKGQRAMMIDHRTDGDLAEMITWTRIPLEQRWRMIGWVMVAMFIAVWFSFMICPAAAQQMMLPGAPCADNSDIADQLIKRYGESRSGMGIHGDGSLVELWLSEETGTWTIVVTRPDGLSCIRAAGKGWEALPKPKPQDEPA
jgi:hypothetical protein